MNAHEPMPRGGGSTRLTPSALLLMESARRRLASGRYNPSPPARYGAAYHAALGAAAAVVAAKSGLTRRRRRPRNVWELLPSAAPSLGEWAVQFAATPGVSRPVWLGRRRAISHRQADQLLREAEAFVSLAEETLGLPAQPRSAGAPCTRLRRRNQRGRDKLKQGHRVQ
jgi:SAV_6107-like HEPN